MILEFDARGFFFPQAIHTPEDRPRLTGICTKNISLELNRTRPKTQQNSSSQGATSHDQINNSALNP